MLTPEQLYQPDKFKVHLGEGKHVGFCTAWNEPETAIKRAPELEQKCTIIGTLYGRQGVNIILRNLALNPQIRRLYVWGFGALSQTKFGIMGTGVLKSLWAKGIADDRTVFETNFKCEPEIDPAIIRTIIANVELIDLSADPLEEAVKKINDDAVEPYMEPVRFPDAKPEALDRYPSEVVGWLVRGETIIDAWKRVVERIMTYGAVKGTQYGSQQKELISVSWVVRAEDPQAPALPEDWPQELRELTGATPDAIEQYRSVFLSPTTPEGISYTYGNRLMAYPHTTLPIDQIAEVIVKSFKSSPDTRRGVATTMAPGIDKDSNEPPCMTQLQFLQSDGALHALATFRSHDIFKAAIPNAFGLRWLQKRVSDELGFTLGQMQITSQSAHIYESDWGQAKKMTACSFTERDPELVFRAEDADPRGNLLIRLDGPTIIATLMGPNGAEIMSIEGKSARYLQKKLGQLELFTKPDHWMDIGMELQKAQIAKDKGIAYTQDRPLIL